MIAELLGGGLVHASLALFEPPSTPRMSCGTPLGRIPLQFNPDRVRLRKSAAWARTEEKYAASVATPEFLGPRPAEVSLEVFLDATDSLDGHVETEVAQLLACCRPTDASAAASKPSPPCVRLEWGHSRTFAFLAFITSVDIEYTLFSPDGAPLRAVCSLAMEEIGGSPPQQNPTSGTPDALLSHTLVDGEDLQYLAWLSYGDPTLWRTIAAANEVLDPTRLAPGTQLIIPRLDAEAPPAPGVGDA
ncbi:CIS tube protein [Streptomyces yaizuensis]|uniref:LysM peptidoglycan-binding domain-containing protein n=1 Tax=Streptomyces yaizuensis TaxID=2989713 RepID=A0ABQ5NYE2_9ACTN|nr:peptidase M23 [Streptomyces sp. YSPA8]GLF95274.1 LysM peptidoglycan-binding domain-containing protein [Streptomyces sp. YSPA8]